MKTESSSFSGDTVSKRRSREIEDVQHLPLASTCTWMGEHTYVYTPQEYMHIHTLTKKKPILNPDCALSYARRPRCLRPLEAEIRRPAAVQLQSGKKLLFHLPPFHSVKRSSWGKASLNTGECFPGDGRNRARSNRFSQQEIH